MCILGFAGEEDDWWRHEQDGLYYLDIMSLVQTFSIDTSPFRWHYHLVHPSILKLKRLLLIEISNIECELYELGKHHHVSFPSRVNKHSVVPFDIVHCDIWGLSKVKSYRGFHYFAIFVNDFSKMTWMYLLKDIFKIPHVLNSFCNEIKTQFSISLCTLCTDNALEFIQKNSTFFVNDRVLSIKTLALTHHSKMEWLSVSIDISLMLLVL